MALCNDVSADMIRSTLILRNADTDSTTRVFARFKPLLIVVHIGVSKRANNAVIGGTSIFDMTNCALPSDLE